MRSRIGMNDAGEMHDAIAAGERGCPIDLLPQVGERRGLGDRKIRWRRWLSVAARTA